jgi:hypothetical protein
MNPGAVRRAIGVCCATWALALGWCASFTLGTDEPLDPNNANHVLVFQSGRTLKGKVSRSPNGYVVEHGAGRLVVPFEEVRVVGDSLPDAYRRLRESFVNLTAATHYELAKWCWTHQLREEARSELVMALDRDADHVAARDLLERIDEQLAAGRKKPAAPKPPEPRIVGGVELPDVESLAGLSRETASRYSTRIQPLLMNKCANASCHGPKSTRELHLEPIRGTGPGHRMYSERNLARVLDQLDLARPNHSPLLTAADGNHGGLNRAIFYGPSGDKQRQMLADWVKAVSKEQQAAQKQQDRRPRVAGKNAPSRSAAALEKPMTESKPPPQAQARLASKAEDTAPEDDDVAEDQVDAFDPSVFNQKYHGRPEEKSSRRPKPPDKDSPREPSP